MPVKTNNTRANGIELFCASPASTAICKATITKPLCCLNSYIGDHYKSFTNTVSSYSPSRAPCISELPLTPRRKSSADVYGLRKHLKHSHYTSNYGPPSHSSRYLLGECSPFLDSLSSDSEFHTKEPLALLPTTPVIRSDNRQLRKSRSQVVRPLKDEDDRKSLPLASANPIDQRIIKSGICRTNESADSKSSSSFAPTRDQVVTLRVSLHCKACEAKLRKHLSKMEGVTLFSIDREIKKVTVIGKVAPLDVLTSISKVKNAQFWASGSTTSPSSSSTSSGRSSTSTLELGRLTM